MASLAVRRSWETDHHQYILLMQSIWDVNIPHDRILEVCQGSQWLHR